MDDLKNSSSYKIISHLLENDPFSQWMGVIIKDTGKGYCKISCSVKSDMLNGFNVTHGGIVFALADTALAFSAATFGEVSLAIDNSISFTKKSVTGDQLTATSSCLNITRKTGLFEIKVTNSADELIAVMKGTVYRTGNKVELPK